MSLSAESQLAPGRVPTFLLDIATGRSLKLDPQGFVAFTADGTRAAWLEADSDFETGDVRLRTSDLARAGSSSTTVVQHQGSSGWMFSLTFSPENAFAMDAGLPSDGRVALAEAGPSGAQVRLFDPEGHELALVPLGRARSVRVGGEPRPGLLAVGLDGASFGPSDLALVDTEKARVVRIEKGLAPPRSWVQSDPVKRGGAGGPSASVFLDGNGAVVRLDPESGERRRFLPGAPRGGPYP